MAGFDKSQATAGLRGAYWDPARIDDDVRIGVHPLRTDDGQIVSGYHLARGGESSIAVLAHPREHVVASYLAAELLDQGIAVFVQAPRSIGNDIRLEHEIALHDLAAAMRFVHGLGYRQHVAVGNSGGGPLWAFYNQQALLDGSKRLTHTPGGRPTKLDTATLIAPDALVFVSSHLGQGKLLMNCIDGSLTDERDAFSVDASLDPFDRANGFSPQGAAYTAEFLERYRRAQHDRVARIDAVAREQVAERAAARARAKDGGSRFDRMREAHTPVLPIWRTDADPRCWDLTIDPSDRKLGSLWGANPAASNFGSVGFARLCTAESWLSTWSGLTSRASMEACAPAIEQPALMIEYSGDASTFPQDNDQLFGWIGTSAKQRARFKGDHHGRPVHDGDPDSRPAVGALIAEWLNDTASNKRTA